MKKILLLTVALAICSVSAASAARIRVRVMDFTFQPATISAHVGDVIIWRWVNGMHTTTSTSVPAGAQTWNSPIDSTHTQFRYGLRVPGAYQYQCNFHFRPGNGGGRLWYPPHVSDAYLIPDSVNAIPQASSPLSRYRFKTLIPSNETKLSDGHRGRASLELKGFNHAKRKREASGRSPSA